MITTKEIDYNFCLQQAIMDYEQDGCNCPVCRIEEEEILDKGGDKK